MVSGKWWGDKSSNYRPILALHGWQDNAGSFDGLMEHMNLERPVVAIDLPGHGWSSPIYPTMVYHTIDTVLLVRRIQKHYSWDVVTFLTHSMGGITSFLFSSLYPESVDFIINLDMIKPLEENMDMRADDMGPLVDEIIDLMRRTPSQEGWTAEELRDRWIRGSGNSLTKESAEILMKRGIKEIKPNRYIYSRDSRLKAWQLQTFEVCENLKLAKNIKCPILLINGSHSPFWKLTINKCPEIVKVFEENTKSFHVLTVEGSHHFHLNDPKSVAPMINNFLDRMKRELK